MFWVEVIVIDSLLSKDLQVPRREGPSPNHTLLYYNGGQRSTFGAWAQQRQGWREISGVMNAVLGERKEPMMLEADITLRRWLWSPWTQH